MERSLQVVLSNALNRYGYRFSVGALTRGLFAECLGGIPLLIAHDASRLIGWTWPLAVHLAPGLVRLVSLTGTAESEEDNKEIERRFNYHLYKSGVERFESEIQELRHILSDHLTGNEKAVAVECAALTWPGLAARAFPELFAKQDKDGLISLQELTPIGSGVFQVGKLVVFAHSFLRRNLYSLNTLNYPFLEQLQLLDSIAFSPRIALDPDTVGLASTYDGGRSELAYWWGPEFNDDLASIPVGVRRYEEDDKFRKAFSGIARTEFRWGSRKGEHILEVEEIRATPSPLIPKKYGCRFIHSIIKEDSGEIIHFDGSIRMYSEEEMMERLELDLSRAGRNTEYKKLWRCDGQIEIFVWKKLLSDYFRDNYFVGEYLGATNPFDKAQVGVEEYSVKEKFVPYSMEPGAGLRVAISYQSSLDVPPGTDRWVVPMDIVSDGNETHQYIEPYGFELRKALQRLGTPLDIHEEIHVVSFRDLYANFPLVFHNRDHLPGNLHQTIQAIKMLVENWCRRGLNIVLSYKVGFPVTDDRDVYVSFLGHVDDVAAWFSNPLSLPPAELEGLHQWAEDVSSYLNDEYPATLFDTPPLLRTLMTSGVLFVDRQSIPDEWEVHYKLRPEGLAYELVIPEDQGTLAGTIAAEGIRPVLAMQVLASRCTNCGHSYFYCSCSKILDENVVQEITDARPGRMFWTDRPA